MTHYFKLPGKLNAYSLIILLAIVCALTFNQQHVPQHGSTKGPDSNLTTYEELHIPRYDNSSLLARRDETSCSKGIPCKQNACCGSFKGTKNGVCGLGPEFCGSDCDSKCDAKAECGAAANPPGKKCPLNVCCSKFGFCGTTEDFCSTGCQSNCALRPSFPPKKINKNVLEHRVIGYYDASAAARKCQTVRPANIPVAALTHVNFAFASIDPKTLQIVPMDSKTPAELFAEVTELKGQQRGNSELQVFISIGGWTFSDNGTATQPLFSQISADSAKRSKFADNLVTFMYRYGFDGVDIDWEYPGAPDRGGLKEIDTVTFVELLKTLRETFEASPRGNYGLSFTIPSSYWYLRWFNLPALLKYADWTNLMSYDLHGTWDSSSHAGPIVQAHTNLTEIQHATNLLWRNQVKPEQVVLGLGFYGRSFQLRDKNCNIPGCAFKGPASAGECTNQAGTLAYSEIVDIINQQHPKVMHDAAAAVKYFTYGAQNDQWVSYDDKDTFKTKVDWANSIGLGGIMIWSIDQDDPKYTGLEGLFNRSVKAVSKQFAREEKVNVDHWSAMNGQGCVISDCTDEDWRPPAGFGVVPKGRYPDTCRPPQARNVYCPLNGMPTACRWDGGPKWCHGQCQPGEITLAHSMNGDQACVPTMQQALCCVSNTWSRLVQKCRWADGCDCPSDAPFPVSKSDHTYTEGCNLPLKFCCPYEFQNCHWVGQGECFDRECGATDVQVALDPLGDNGVLCQSGAQKPLCCNAPKNLNFFVPAPLEDLFPSLPPTTYIPAFDLQTITSLPRAKSPTDTTSQGFFMVVIDGPANQVVNLNRRDGSHIEFVTGPVHHGQASQTAHFVCMDDSEASNCDDMHLDGLEGTIARLPDHFGFAHYGVIHDVRPSNYSLPRHLLPHAPRNARVLELEYSYDFSKVRNNGGSIYARVDYSNSNEYMRDIVQAKHEKRQLGKRFWSSSLEVWKRRIEKIRQSVGDFLPSVHIGDERISVLIYGNDGKASKCADARDGSLGIRYVGSLLAHSQFGFTMVGTISPDIKFEQAYGYFDSAIDMKGTLNFNGKGFLETAGAAGLQRKLLVAPLSIHGASHPGLISFKPELDVDVSLTGYGNIDADFSVTFSSQTDGAVRSHAPPNLGEWKGGAKQETHKEAGRGKVSSLGRQSTIFGINFVPRSRMSIEVNKYGTNSKSASASFAVSAPYAIRVVGNDGKNKPGIYEYHREVLADVIQRGEKIRADWEDGLTHTFGNRNNSAFILAAGSAPEPRPPKDTGGAAIFSSSDLITCSRNTAGPRRFLCSYNITMDDDSGSASKDPEDSGSDDSKDELKLRATVDSPSAEQLLKRTGNRRPFRIKNVTGKGKARELWRSDTYPAGEDGAELDAALADPSEDPKTNRGKRYSLARPEICEDTSVTASGSRPANYDTVQTDHPIDLAIVPNSFMRFIQRGNIKTRDDKITDSFQSQLPLADWRMIEDYWNKPPDRWPEEERKRLGKDVPRLSTASLMAAALGNRDRPHNLVSLESNMNRLKGTTYTRQGDFIAEDKLKKRLDSAADEDALAILTQVRTAIAQIEYLNMIVEQRRNVLRDLRRELENFDELFARATGRNERLAPLHDEFWREWEIGYESDLRSQIRSVLNQVVATWRPIFEGNGPGSTTEADDVSWVLTLATNLGNKLSETKLDKIYKRDDNAPARLALAQVAAAA